MAGPALPHPREKGLALIAVLWGLVLLSVIALSVTTTSRTETRIAFNLAENAKARALAEAGVHRALMGLLKTAAEATGAESAAVPGRRPGFGRPPPEAAEGGASEPEWRADGTVYPWLLPGGEVRISLHDEGGKIDLNRAPDGLLQGLFVAVGLDPGESAALVDAIADFRDPDDLRRLNGAEDDDYRAAGHVYGAKDRPFEATEELGQVLGMTPALYAQVAPVLTVYSRRRRVRQATAPPLVLEALLGPAAALEREEAEAGAESGGTIGAGASAALTRSTLLTIRSEAHTETGSVFVREAVVLLSGGARRPFRILAWKQGRLTASD